MSNIQRKRAFLSRLAEQARAAKKETGKGIGSQCAEILALRCGVGRLAPDEYFQYNLYDDRQYTWREKTQFLGRWMENGLIPILEEERWVGMANDKLVSYALFKGLGFPSPENYAVYHPVRSFGSIPAFRTPLELAAFIRSAMPVPFVAKPVFGMWGRDVVAVRSRDPREDLLTMTSGRTMSVDAFAQAVASRRAGGTLFQELLRPHPIVEQHCGDRICSVRMVVLVPAAAPARLISTVWKIATGSSMADNYWEPGNMIAAVDPENGRIGRPFTGLGRDIRFIDAHPDTGERLTGMTLPDWPAAVSLCLNAAASMPGIRMQAWDIAITDRGPTLLEVNVNGGMRLPQLAAKRGLYQGEFRQFLECHGYPKRLSLKRLLFRSGEAS